MGTNEECMAWVKDEVDRVVALPREVGGIPLDEIGATGWGLSHVVDETLKFCDFNIQGARIAVQGFGAVGKHVTNFLSLQGAIQLQSLTLCGTIYNPDGLDVKKLILLKKRVAVLPDTATAKSLIVKLLLISNVISGFPQRVQM